MLNCGWLILRNFREPTTEMNESLTGYISLKCRETDCTGDSTSRSSPGVSCDINLEPHLWGSWAADIWEWMACMRYSTKAANSKPKLHGLWIWCFCANFEHLVQPQFLGLAPHCIFLRGLGWQCSCKGIPNLYRWWLWECEHRHSPVAHTSAKNRGAPRMISIEPSLEEIPGSNPPQQ